MPHSRSLPLCTALLVAALASGRCESKTVGVDAFVKAIQDGAWSAGQARCASLAESEARRSDRRQLAAAHYAELAAYCAAIASGAADPDEASWWWFTAAAIDSKTALALLPEFEEKGLLRDLPAYRRPANSDPQTKYAKDQVLLPDGKVVSGVGADGVPFPKPPSYLFSHVQGVARTEIHIEVLVGKDGVPREPVLLSARALPIHAFLAFRYLGTWRFKPARVDGDAVVSAVGLSVSQSSG